MSAKGNRIRRVTSAWRHVPATSNAQAIFQEAVRRHMAGRVRDAVTRYGQTLALNPDHAEAHNNLGVALASLTRVDDAVAHYRRAVALKPDYAHAHNNAGVALAELGRFDDAVAHYEQAVALDPDYADAHDNLGMALAALGRPDAAAAHHERALRLKPNWAKAHNNLGAALMALGKADEAAAHFERAIALDPANADAHSNLGVGLATKGRLSEAVAHYERALRLRPGIAQFHNNLGAALAELGRIDDAIAHIERAAVLEPGKAAFHNNLGVALVESGQIEAAALRYGRAISLDPEHPEAHFNRAEIKTFTAEDADLAALEALATRGDLPGNGAASVHFALGKALEDTREYRRAFEHLRKANELTRERIEYDEPGVAALFRRIAGVFSRELFDRFEGQGDPSEAPVFVLGMPRSGSTLVEQILASHSQIHAAGEIRHLGSAVAEILMACDLPPYPESVPSLDGAALRRMAQAYFARLPAAAEGTTRIVDKLPDNFMTVGLIRMILPNAKIIHTVREAADTCLSCYSTRFAAGQAFSYDLRELGRYYRRYSELMAHWRSILPADAMLEVSYENVVEDLEGQARRLIEYCGLPWDERCVSFDKTIRPVRTASAAQVRRPLFRSSLGRWRRYEAELAPLFEELGIETR